MKRPSTCAVAVIGASRLLGRELLTVLRERRFPLGDCRLLETQDRVGEAGEAEPIALLHPARFRDADVVFGCAPESVVAEWAPVAVSAGAVVIDLSQVFAEHADVPLVVPEVNPDALGDLVERRIVTSPVAGATALSVVLKPLDNWGRLQRVVVAGCEPVSAAGDAGIDELSFQTGELMNGRSVETSAFPHRVAFNLIPQVGALLAGSVARGERQIQDQLRRVLELPGLPVSVACVWTPTFFGHGYMVNVETESALDAEQARVLLRESPGIMVVDETADAAGLTTTDAVGEEAVLVGRIRDDPSVPHGLNLWVAVDGVRKGGAVNAVQIAELLVRDHL